MSKHKNKASFRKEIIFGDIVNDTIANNNIFTIGSGFSSFDFTLNRQLNLRKDDPFLLKEENKYVKEAQLEFSSSDLEKSERNAVLELKMSTVNAFLHFLKNAGQINSYFLNKFSHHHSADLSGIVCKTAQTTTITGQFQLLNSFSTSNCRSWGSRMCCSICLIIFLMSSWGLLITRSVSTSSLTHH